MAAQKAKTINMIEGRASVGHTHLSDVKKLLEHIWALEALLDEADGDDVFGTEGWRHRLGIE